MLVEAHHFLRANLGVHQSTKGVKRRKLNPVDAELHHGDVDLFLAQIVVILRSCLMSLS